MGEASAEPRVVNQSIEPAKSQAHSVSRPPEVRSRPTFSENTDLMSVCQPRTARGAYLRLFPVIFHNLSVLPEPWRIACDTRGMSLSKSNETR